MQVHYHQPQCRCPLDRVRRRWESSSLAVLQKAFGWAAIAYLHTTLITLLAGKQQVTVQVHCLVMPAAMSPSSTSDRVCTTLRPWQRNHDVAMVRTLQVIQVHCAFSGLQEFCQSFRHTRICFTVFPKI
mmetsp:Transcript_21974/g.39391  ORF Transcript_21974/g.39391 Transcript_21974/m.39391 type:complete len:129 (+) Transcript_21974:459-845(+)